MKSELSIVELCNTLSHHDILYWLLVKLDEFYVPPISSQVNLEEYSAKLLRNGRVFCVETIEEGYVGVLAIYTNDFIKKRAFISSIGILPKYHGSGASGDLLLKACAVAIENGMKSISLEVNISNQRAIGCYKKYGFYEEGRITNTLFMTKNLPGTFGQL